VQVIGDLANFTFPKTGKPLPGVSPVAFNKARHAAENVLHMIAGASRKRFSMGQRQHGHNGRNKRG